MIKLYRFIRFLLRFWVQAKVRYYSARIVYAVSRRAGNGHYISCVWFMIQLLTNQIAHAKITFKDF